MVINKARHPNLKLKSHNEGGWQSIKFDFYCFLRKSRAQTTIEMLINSNNENIIDVEIEDNKFLAIKKLYPNATDEQIKKAIIILEQN